MTSNKVERRQIPGLEGSYSITRDANVYSDARSVECHDGRVMNFKERILKQKTDSLGHLQVSLSVDCKPKSYLVSTLLKAAFPELFPPIENLPDETWKPVMGFPLHAISDKGRVKLVRRERTTGHVTYTAQEELLVVSKKNADDYSVKLHLEVEDSTRSEQYSRSVSRLVYQHFVGVIADGQRVKFISSGECRLHASNLYI